MSVLRYEYRIESGQAIQARHGDLTQEKVDAIVNAANTQLAHGGGVAGAIVRSGGRIIQQESDRWVQDHGPVPTGETAVTSAGSLPCRFVIHSVGPVWHGGINNEDKLLYQAAWNSLLRAHELRLATIALPAISSGIFGFPKERCAALLIKATLDFCARHPESPLREIRFTSIDLQTVSIFEAELKRLSTDAPSPTGTDHSAD